MHPFIPFALPHVTESEIRAVEDVLRSNWLTTGPRAKALETDFREAVGAEHCVAVSSCTAALHLALDAAGVGEEDEVIVPTMTFAATAEVVDYLGAVPVLVDVRASDHNLDPEAVEAAITDRTRAIMPVHFGGVPADMDEISRDRTTPGDRGGRRRRARIPVPVSGAKRGDPRRRHLLLVLCHQDDHHGGGRRRGDVARGLGGPHAHHVAPRHLARRVEALHGRRELALRDPRAAGFKYNLGDIAAALGLAQLERAEAMRARRAAIAARYDDAFGDEPAVELLRPAPDRTNAHHLYVVKIEPRLLDIDRDELHRRARRARRRRLGPFHPACTSTPTIARRSGIAPRAFPSRTTSFSGRSRYRSIRP